MRLSGARDAATRPEEATPPPVPSAATPAGDLVPVLFVHSGLDWIRGSERCLLDLIAGLDRRRFRPVLWCDAPTMAAEARALGAEVELSPSSWERLGDRLPPDRGLVRQARRLVAEHGVRLVHANSILPLKWLLPAVRGARVPLLVHLHLPTSADERVYNAVHQASLAVAVSRSAAEGLGDDGASPRRVRVIYNGIDRRRLAAGDATGLRAQLGIPPDAVVIATVGSLIERKGVDVLLRAFALLLQRSPACRLLVVGSGPERPALEALAGSLEIAGAVHFLGERRDVGAILRDAADVAASAARQEAFPLNLLEAAMVALPIAASAIPPHRESVVEGETGLLAAPGDPAALADALQALVADPALRRKMGEAGRARAEREFLVEHYVARFAGTYEELLRRPARTYGWLGEWAWPPLYWKALARAVVRRLRPRRRPAGAAR